MQGIDIGGGCDAGLPMMIISRRAESARLLLLLLLHHLVEIVLVETGITRCEID